ncbi:MAG: matrixin family metalloprotease, partial [Chloroflexota bacterium]
MTRKLLAQAILLVGCLFLLLPVAQAQAAQSLNYGQPVEGSLSAGQQIDYTFVGKVGDKPIITMNAHGGSMVPYLQLYDPQGRLIGEDSGSGEKGNALLKGFVLPVDGTYKITAANKAQSDSGKYGLLVNEAKQQVFFDGTPADNQSGKQNYQLSQPWDHKNITYHILNGLNGFSNQDVETVIAQAFQSWSNDAPISFTEVQGQGDINIEFGQIDGSLNILGETCPPYNPCNSGSVTFDDAENWTLGQPNGYGDISLLGVASHELGHAIGMLHTDDPNALMYPEYSPYNLQPGQDDMAGVQRLYGTGSGTVSNPPSLPNGTGSNSQNQMQVSG